jgi:hypothetical protein
VHRQVCSWLLQILDRLQGGDVVETQERITSMLRVRRQSAHVRQPARGSYSHRLLAMIQHSAVHQPVAGAADDPRKVINSHIKKMCCPYTIWAPTVLAIPYARDAARPTQHCGYAVLTWGRFVRAAFARRVRNDGYLSLPRQLSF